MRDSKLPKRQYTDECRVEAIRLAESVGSHEAARRLGAPVAAVGNWKRRRATTGVRHLRPLEVVQPCRRVAR